MRPIATDVAWSVCLFVCVCVLPNSNALLAVINGMQAVKLYTNKILQFLTGGAG